MTPSPAPRLHSLDQFRGYTVAAMFVVNFMGGFAATPALLRHHNTWCSYADTVMPQFFFAVGMALRLVLLREVEAHGWAKAMRRGARRALALIVLGFCFYGPGGHWESWRQLTTAGWGVALREIFLTGAIQALTHIGLTSLFVLPVIAGPAKWRVAYALAAAGLHAWMSRAFWYETLHRWHVIDGGPLGFLTWTLPVVAGSLALDAVRARPQGAAGRLLAWSAPLMLGGYALACLTGGGVWAAPPFVPPWHPVDMWTMSQRAGSVSYLLFSAGFSLAVYAGFHGWSDRRGGGIGLFRDLGLNALAGYLIHMILLGVTDKLGPRDSPLWWVLTLTGVGFAASWMAVRWTNARKLFLRL